MNVIILTSSVRGSASVHLDEIIKSDLINVKMVVLNEGKVPNKKKFYKRKLNKIFKIGALGALIGIKMRKWYSTDIEKYLDISSIEKICSENNIPLKVTPTINCQTTISYFKEANADLGLSLGNGYIGSKVFNIPNFGMINIHHEELPEYQNAQSIIWQIYNNSKFTGYTIHKIDKGIDTGEILYKEKIPITFRETLADTVSFNYAKLNRGSSQGLVKILENFQYYFDNGISQTHGNSYTTPSLLKYLKIRSRFNKLKNLRTDHV